VGREKSTCWARRRSPRTDVALLQAAAADPVGDLSLNYGGNAAARRRLERLDT
jgi:hypothetical protein